mgnify:CR=1 FL=1
METITVKPTITWVERISMNHLNVVFEIVDVIPMIGSNVSIRTLEEQVELKHTL